MKPIRKSEEFSSSVGCSSIRQALESAELNAQMPTEIESHCHNCPACQRYAQELGALRSIVMALPRVNAPADFDIKLRQRIAASRAPRPFFAWPRFMRQPAFAMAAVAVIAATVGFGLRGIQKPDHAPVSVSVAVNFAPAVTPKEMTPPAITAPVVKVNTSPRAVAVTEMAKRSNPVRTPRQPRGDEYYLTIEEVDAMGAPGNRRMRVPVPTVVSGAQPIINMGTRSVHHSNNDASSIF